MKKLEFRLRLGFTCNCKCVMCYFYSKLNTIDMPTAEAKKCILTAKKSGVSRLLLTGGEPTIRKDFINLLSYAIDLDIPEIEIQTNGRMFYYDDFAKKVSDIQSVNTRMTFLVPVYGHKKEIHDSITDSPGSFDETIAGIKNLIRYKFHFTVKTVLLKQNYKHLTDILKLMKKMGISSMNISSVCVSPETGNSAKKYVPKFTDMKSFLHNTIKIANKSNFKVRFCSIPLCFITPFEKMREEKIPYEMVFLTPRKDKKEIESKKKSASKPKMKIKPEKCRNCSLFSECSGIWTGYTEIYGTKEFVPVKIIQ